MTGITSYAQNFEDVMLWRALHHIGQGFYIDIGAQHPVIDSVSMAFYEKGWRGIHVEPCAAYADLLREKRPDETVIQAVISNRKERLTFFEIPETGLSTADPEIAQRHRKSGYEVRETSVTPLLLDEVFKQAAGDIHWLKIDVEGWEKQVLTSWRQSAARPWIVVVESTLPNTQEDSFEQWESLLLKRGYLFVYFDGLNRFYVHEEHEELFPAFQVPPNIFDEFWLSRSTPHCAGLNHSIAELDNQLSEVSRETDELQKKIEQTRSQAEQTESTLQERIAKTTAAIEKQQTEYGLLEREWNAAKSRIEQLAADLALRQSDNQALSTELEQARQILADNQRALDEERGRSRRFEEECETARKRIEQLAADLALRQSDNQALSTELEQARHTLADSAERAHRAEVRLEEFASKLRQKAIEAEQINSQLQSTEARLAHTESQAADSYARANHLEAQRAEAQAHHEAERDRLNAENNDLKTRLNESLGNAHHWWLTATAHEQAVKALKSSWSWHLTWPLRKALDVSRWLAVLPIRLLSILLGPSLRRSMAFVLHRPRLRGFLSAVLQKAPFLYWRLFRAGQQAGLPVTATAGPAQGLGAVEDKAEQTAVQAGTAASEHSEPEPDLSALTPHARRIYADLKAAIEAKQNSENRP